MNRFLGLILFLLAVAFLFRVEIIFYLIYIMIGLYFWSRWSVPRRHRKLTCAREVANHAFWNETVEATLTIKNNTLFTIPWLEVYESLANELNVIDPVNHVITLRGGETVELKYQVHTSRRGFYRLGPTRVTSGGVFGFIPEQSGVFIASYMTVYPRIYPLTKIGLPSRLPFGTISSQQRLFEDPARPMGVREFRSGDSIRQINWKTTAHTRNLVVNTLQPAISLETVLILDLENDSFTRRTVYEDVEWAIEVAASLAAHLVGQRQAVGLMTNGVDPLQGIGDDLEFDQSTGRLKLPKKEDREEAYAIAPANGRAHLMKILEQLARLERTNRHPFHEWLSHKYIPVSWGGTVIVITPQADEALCGVLFQLVKKGMNPLLLQIRRSSNFKQIRERARHLGFRAHMIAKPEDIQVKVN